MVEISRLPAKQSDIPSPRVSGERVRERGARDGGDARMRPLSPTVVGERGDSFIQLQADNAKSLASQARVV